MKNDEEADELKPEYDFSHMSGGVRGKYAAASWGDTNLVRLEQDAATTSTTDSSGNAPLRADPPTAPEVAKEPATAETPPRAAVQDWHRRQS